MKMGLCVDARFVCLWCRSMVGVKKENSGEVELGRAFMLVRSVEKCFNLSFVCRKPKCCRQSVHTRAIGLGH